MTDRSPDPRPDIDVVLQTALPDDLPPDVEARLNDQVERFLADRRHSIPGVIAAVTDWLASVRAYVGGGIAARSLHVAASAVLVLGGIALHAAGRPGLFAASVDRVREPVAAWRAIDRAVVMRCGSAAAADLGSPAELAERVYRHWALVSTIDVSGTTAVMAFRSPGDGAQYTLVVDRKSMLPNRIVKTLPHGSKPSGGGGAYDAVCRWETPDPESGSPPDRSPSVAR